MTTGSDPSNEAGAWLESDDGRVAELTTPFKIGRAAHCNLRVEGTKASREHALLSFDPAAGQWWLSDLRSTNGTYLNGRKLTQSARLHPGDVIRVGSSTWLFRLESSGAGHHATMGGLDVTVANLSSARCWLMIGDVIGSTRLAQELEADELGSRMKTWAASCEQIVVKHGGYVNEFLGDGFLAVWDEREAGAREVLEALRELRAWRPQSPLAFRTITHRGKVLIGGGGPSSGVERLTGADLHFIFKAEKVVGASKEGDLFLSAAAAEKLEPLAELRQIGEYAVPSFEERCAFFTLPE